MVDKKYLLGVSNMYNGHRQEEVTMELTLPEIIQLLRRRKGLNQAELGVQAFGLAIDSARTKIKNIELGRQRLSGDDTEKLALVLDVQPETLIPELAHHRSAGAVSTTGCQLTSETLQLFPGLEAYVEMLNNAVRIGDHDLIAYIAGRLSSVFETSYKGRAAAQN